MDKLQNYRERFRTAVNILGDSFGAGLVDHLTKADIERNKEERKKSIIPMEILEKARRDSNDVRFIE